MLPHRRRAIIVMRTEHRKLGLSTVIHDRCVANERRLRAKRACVRACACAICIRNVSVAFVPSGRAIYFRDGAAQLFSIISRLSSDVTGETSPLRVFPPGAAPRDYFRDALLSESSGIPEAPVHNSHSSRLLARRPHYAKTDKYFRGFAQLFETGRVFDVCALVFFVFLPFNKRRAQRIYGQT